MGESPLSAGLGYTSRNMLVFIDIDVIVKIDETIMNRLPERGPDRTARVAQIVMTISRTPGAEFRFLIFESLQWIRFIQEKL